MLASIAAAVTVGVRSGGPDGGPERDSDENAIPPEMVGTYTGFPESFGESVLYIATTGGPDGGPMLAIDEGLTLEPTKLRVEDGVLKLLNQRCDVGDVGESADNSYGWRLDGSTLTLTLISNLCKGRDQAIEILLGGWTKTSETTPWAIPPGLVGTYTGVAGRRLRIARIGAYGGAPC